MSPRGPNQKTRTKALAVKTLLAHGETIRSTADAMGLDKGTIVALAKSKLLSDEDLGLIERSLREKNLKIADRASDLLLEKGKLEKLNGVQLSQVIKDSRKSAEGDKPNTALLCETLILKKYAIMTPPVIDMPTRATTEVTEKPLLINEGMDG